MEAIAGKIVLDFFRQKSQITGRSLLGSLLFVWLSMAITPCAMANEAAFLSFALGPSDNIALHAKMDKCIYCPDVTLAEKSVTSKVVNALILCQNDRTLTFDSLNSVFDPIDAEPFSLLEIPYTLPSFQTLARNYVSAPPSHSYYSSLSPLQLTGVLRI